MFRMTDGQLDEIHNEAIKLHEKARFYTGSDMATAYASQSIAASNLVIIELMLRQRENDP